MANKKSALEITGEIEKAKEQEISGSDIVLNKKTSLCESLYYHESGEEISNNSAR